VNIFIDTNIFLSFYHFTSDDLEELRKLAVLLEKKIICLILPNQVVDEFYRNREKKIADAIKRLHDQRLNLQFPQFCKDYKEYEELRKLQKDYATLHAGLLAKINDDITNEKLKADATIKDLFKLGTNKSVDEAIIQKARLRIELGNPPGKSGSLGDAINWETLIKTVPGGEKLYFITDDKDYTSPKDENVFNGFLLKEWTDKKKEKLVFYKSLSDFFKEHFPEITLASEMKKDLLIRDLANSNSFTKTHEIVAQLNKYREFTSVQANAIVSATIANNQIYWIINDPDVKDFITGIISGKDKQISQAALNELKEYLKSKDSEDENDMPF